eukprot:14158348-Heterocapsa_arctica.AAC.1
MWPSSSSSPITAQRCGAIRCCCSGRLARCGAMAGQATSSSHSTACSWQLPHGITSTISAGSRLQAPPRA